MLLVCPVLDLGSWYFLALSDIDLGLRALVRFQISYYSFGVFQGAFGLDARFSFILNLLTTNAMNAPILEYKYDVVSNQEGCLLLLPYAWCYHYVS